MTVFGPIPSTFVREAKSMGAFCFIFSNVSSFPVESISPIFFSMFWPMPGRFWQLALLPEVFDIISQRFNRLSCATIRSGSVGLIVIHFGVIRELLKYPSHKRILHYLIRGLTRNKGLLLLFIEDLREMSEGGVSAASKQEMGTESSSRAV